MAIEEALQHGPVRLIKRNRTAAVVISENQYRQFCLRSAKAPAPSDSAYEWLLNLEPFTSGRSKASIDADLAEERSW